MEEALVVADEVALAKRTQDSTTEISDMLSQLGHATEGLLLSFVKPKIRRSRVWNAHKMQLLTRADHLTI